MKRFKPKDWLEGRIRDFSDNISKFINKDDDTSKLEREVLSPNPLYSTPSSSSNKTVHWSDMSNITPSGDLPTDNDYVSPTIDYPLRTLPFGGGGEVPNAENMSPFGENLERQIGSSMSLPVGRESMQQGTQRDTAYGSNTNSNMSPYGDDIKHGENLENNSQQIGSKRYVSTLEHTFNRIDQQQPVRNVIMNDNRYTTASNTVPTPLGVPAYSDIGTVSEQVQAPIGAYSGNNEQFIPDMRCPPGLPSMVTDSYIPPAPVNNDYEAQTNQQESPYGSIPPLVSNYGNLQQNIPHRFVPTYQPYDFSERVYQNTNTLPFGSQPSVRPSIDTYDYGYYEPPRRLPDINSLYQQPEIPQQRRPSGSFAYNSSQTRSAGYTVKPSKFNGEDWEAYKLQFNSCAKANKWSEDDCGRYLAACLIGNAAYTLALKDNGDWSFKELWDALEERYGQPSSEFLVRNKLRKVRQQNNQSLQSLADEILQLVRGCSNSQWERDRLAVDAFIEALSDLEVRRYLLEKEPTNIQEALKKARKFDDIKSASGVPFRNPRVFNTEQSTNQNVPDPYKELEELKAKQAQLEYELMMARQELSNNYHPPNNRGGFHQRGQPPRFHRGDQNNRGGYMGSENPNWRNRQQSA